MLWCIYLLLVEKKEKLSNRKDRCLNKGVCMYKIAICDDEVGLGTELEELLLSLFQRSNKNCEIDVYFTGEGICEGIRVGLHYDLIFLDINFAESDFSGINVGKFIRLSCQNNKTSIVYMSWDESYALDLFKIRPMDFLIKPLNERKIEETVRTFLLLSKDWSKDFIYKKDHFTLRVRVKDIVYFERQNKKIVIHLVSGEKEEFYDSLKKIYKEQLEGLGFLFVSSTLVVNSDHIASIDYKAIFVKDNPNPISISQMRRSKVRERYVEIVKEGGMNKL